MKEDELIHIGFQYAKETVDEMVKVYHRYLKEHQDLDSQARLAKTEITTGFQQLIHQEFQRGTSSKVLLELAEITGWITHDK